MSAPAAAQAPFTPPSIALAAFGLALAGFMQVLDTTICNVSLPTIAGNLGASASQATWVITSFAVSNAISLPLTGWMVRRFGELRVFLWSTIGFALASVLCGLSTTMGMLVLARALQGFVCGPMFPVAQSLLISIFPPNKRGQAMGILAIVTVVAPICGPLLGGWITDNYSWEWIFFINFPLGLIVWVLTVRQFRGRTDATERPRMDYVGLGLLILGVGSLQILLDMGNDEDWFHSDLILTLAIIATISLVAFVIWELTDDDPVVNLRLFRHRNFATGTLAFMLGFAVFFSVGILVPLWLQRTLGYSAIWAGIATAPIGILPIFLSPLIGFYANRLNLRLVATLAFLVMAATSFIRAGFNLQVDLAHIIWVQFAQGFGMACFFLPVFTILLSDLNPNEIAAGSGLATFARTIGGSFATSLTTYFWSERTIVQHATLAEHFPATDPATRQVLHQLGQGDPTVGAALLDSLIQQQAAQIGFNEIFHALGILFLAVIFFLWLSKPPFTARGGPVVE